MRRGVREGRGADEVEACDVAGGEATDSLSATGSGGVWLESAHGDSSTSIAKCGNPGLWEGYWRRRKRKNWIGLEAELRG